MSVLSVPWLRRHRRGRRGLDQLAGQQIADDNVAIWLARFEHVGGLGCDLKRIPMRANNAIYADFVAGALGHAVPLASSNSAILERVEPIS